MVSNEGGVDSVGFPSWVDERFDDVSGYIDLLIFDYLGDDVGVDYGEVVDVLGGVDEMLELTHPFIESGFVVVDGEGEGEKHFCSKYFKMIVDSFIEDGLEGGSDWR